MIYVRNIFTQDLRDGKQIAFPKEPSLAFFKFDYPNGEADRQISFKFKEKDNASPNHAYNTQVIATRLYSAGGEARIDGQLKQFLRDTLHAKVDDIVVFKFINTALFEFEYIPQGSASHGFYRSMLNNGNHEVVISPSTEGDSDAAEQKGPLQKIFYGAPGTGKSHTVKQLTRGKNKTVVTFHPDTDYSAFAGAYKPQIAGDKKTITYGFVPQSFARAYVAAWNDASKPHYLIIEEINRGNCAQIFGDIFQLLDRRPDGYSDYVIDVDEDFANYIKDKITDVPAYQTAITTLAEAAEVAGGFSFSKIALPGNLYIYATMNTSDQSLFPMDSAFKRRWEWEYLPIDYAKAKETTIQIGDDTYNWGEFLESVNEKIIRLNSVEDKQLGTFFVKAANGKVSFEQFRSKVMFYLWFEVFKDEVGTTETIFRTSTDDSKGFTFGDLFHPDAEDKLRGFMNYIGVNPVALHAVPAEEVES